jgi:hypothetical protein
LARPTPAPPARRDHAEPVDVLVPLQKPVNPFHTTEFTAAELVELLARYGFAEPAVHGCTPGGGSSNSTTNTAARSWRPRWRRHPLPGATRLVADVASVGADDFPIVAAAERDVEASLDLVVFVFARVRD